MPCPIIKTHDRASLWRTVPPRDRSFQEIFWANWLNWNVQEKRAGLTTWHYYNTQCKFLISPHLRKKSMVERERNGISLLLGTHNLVVIWSWPGLLYFGGVYIKTNEFKIGALDIHLAFWNDIWMYISFDGPALIPLFFQYLWWSSDNNISHHLLWIIQYDTYIFIAKK